MPKKRTWWNNPYSNIFALLSFAPSYLMVRDYGWKGMLGFVAWSFLIRALGYLEGRSEERNERERESSPDPAVNHKS